jgi:hypothetical protein
VEKNNRMHKNKKKSYSILAEEPGWKKKITWKT